MKPRVYENPHEGGTRDPRRDHVRIPKEIVLNSLDATCPMLVQAQVVPWWGTGRPAEFSPSGFHPVTGTAHRQEDRRVRWLNRADLATAGGQPHTPPGKEKSEFFGAPSPGGRGFR